MPHLLDTPTRAQTVGAAVTQLIATGGMAAVTTRAIAAESGVSLATLAHQFTNRGRLLGVMASRFGTDLLDRLVLDAVLRRQFDHTALDSAAAMIDGLRSGVCATEDPLTPEQARSALQLGLDCLSRGA